MAPNYSDAAIAQAAKDGGVHLEMLRQAGVLGVQRAVRVTAVPAGNAAAAAGAQKVIHLVRHGQGYHNLLGEVYQQMGVQFGSAGEDLSSNNPYRRPEILDPPLTELGRAQAKALRPQTRQLSPELVVVSPLARATQTALLAFPHLLGTNGSPPTTPFICHEGTREQTGGHVCDACRGLEDLTADFPMVDYSNVVQITAESDGTWSDEREPMAAMVDRAYGFMLWLRDRPEREVAVATHSGFLFALVNAVIDTGDLAEGLSSWFMTGELRSLAVAFEDQ